MNKFNPLYVVTLLVLLCCVSCKHSSGDEEDVMSSYSQSTSSSLVSGFRLQPNIRILANLDSVFFTIDPVAGRIYNADSLPKGTRIDHLGTKLTFGSVVSSATYRVTGGKTYGDTTFVYRSSTVDSIDFTGTVYLDVLSSDGTNSKTYRVEVLVHTVEPDSLIWPTSDRRSLPGVAGNPTQQHTVTAGLNTYCFSREGSDYVLSQSTDVVHDVWTAKSLELPFKPVVDSFSATASSLYLLGNDGTLYQSSDEGESWSSCDVEWHSIIGAYGDRLLGVACVDGAYCHDEYPRPDGFEMLELESGFPISGFTQLVDFDSSWSLNNQVMMAGGILSDGSCTGNVWGYDGVGWGRINSETGTKSLPAITDATLVPYYTFSTCTTNFKVTKFDTWILFGGKLEDGTYNTNIYTSTDQGINWTKSTSNLALPSDRTVFVKAQAVIDSETLSTTRAGAPRRIATLPTTWECPAIYLFGGYNKKGKLYNTVLKGVINRFLFVPLY